MTTIEITEKKDALSAGDWVMAALCFVLPIVLPILLAIYNFARSQKQRGILYLGTIGVQIVIGVLVAVAR
ncbi:hypothetical protein [Polaromonas sp. JS666]|uniref:hypothetical protein n=1 Tax=Polaromonas sp. (strain JS666 / ATCC BAA-500) TaxID=296591 RepID=UPI00059E4A92|nr:hypothetical protein [Polaromonas sp. JS666]